ncbi:MAG: SDR family oxidoreductase [Candidatus Magasanikbacteria bacterium]|nr:SDR family oxidoreductase [Candidatus Magasanikbacteria bacterium]
MRILVTGGAGFIGSHLCDQLIVHGDEVVCVDNLFTGAEQNIVSLMANPKFIFIKHDIVEPLYLDKSVDQIYNLACPASPPHYQLNPVHTIKTSTIGVMNMLGIARRHQARFLQASTSEVYGDPEVHPQTEEYHGNVNPFGPRACYDEGKRYAESICFDYHRTHGTGIKIVRIFNTYGPRMAFNDGRVISNFIFQGLQDKPITIYGSGSQTRSFCYVEDMVAGLIKMMNSPPEITGPINVGNPEEKTVTELAQKIIALTGSSSIITYLPLPQDDPRRRCPDITKAKTLLGWQPTVGLEKGLQKTIADFRQRLGK